MCYVFRSKSSKKEDEAGMSIVKVNLETGVTVVTEDLKKVCKYEFGPFAVLSISYIKSEKAILVCASFCDRYVFKGCIYMYTQ